MKTFKPKHTAAEKAYFKNIADQIRTRRESAILHRPTAGQIIRRTNITVDEIGRSFHADRKPNQGR
jgi:hypothetical protein